MYVEEMCGVRWGERVKVSMLCPKTREVIAIYVRRGDVWCKMGREGEGEHAVSQDQGGHSHICT